MWASRRFSLNEHISPVGQIALSDRHHFGTSTEALGLGAIDTLLDEDFTPWVNCVHLTVKMLLSQVGPNPVLYLLQIRIRYQLAIRMCDTRDQKGDLLFHVPPIE